MQSLVKFMSLGSALVGGVVLLGLIGLNTLSIIGRGLSKLGHALVGGDWMPVWAIHWWSVVLTRLKERMN